MSRNKSRSDAFESIHASAEALHRTGVIDKAIMRNFDASCLAVNRKTIAVADSIATWRGDPAFVEAYEALAE